MTHDRRDRRDTPDHPGHMPQAANSFYYRTPPRPSQPGAEDEVREDPMPDRPEAEKPYPRDAKGPEGV